MVHGVVKDAPGGVEKINKIRFCWFAMITIAKLMAHHSTEATEDKDRATSGGCVL